MLYVGMYMYAIRAIIEEVVGGLHGFTAKAELSAEILTNPYFKSLEAEAYYELTTSLCLDACYKL